MATENDVSVTLNAVTVSEVTVNEPVNGGGHNKDDDSIDTDTCCMCFGRYEDDVLEGVGAEWIYYRCADEFMKIV